jgi:hypothetical protein
MNRRRLPRSSEHHSLLFSLVCAVDVFGVAHCSDSLPSAESGQRGAADNQCGAENDDTI